MVSAAHPAASLLPGGFREGIRQVRRVVLWRRAGAIFIHVPKAAGVSVALALYGRPLGHYTASDVMRRFPCEFNDLYTFTLTRNPLDRAISAYRFSQQGGGGEMAIAREDRYRGPSFESFDRFVSEWLVAQDLLSCDPVFRPQSHFIASNGAVLVDGVFRVEELEQAQEELSRRLGTRISFTHRNRSRWETPVSVSASTRTLVEELYEEDFRLLEY